MTNKTDKNPNLIYKNNHLKTRMYFSNTEKIFEGPDGIMYSALEIKDLISSEWSNDACLGFTIWALEKLNTSAPDISQIVSVMRGQFDIKTIAEASEHYLSSKY